MELYVVVMEDPRQDLIRLARMPMPYGKYKGLPLIDLPEPYVVWIHSNGYPAGKLGQLLAQLYEIKLNGLEYLIRPLKVTNTRPSK